MKKLSHNLALEQEVGLLGEGATAARVFGAGTPTPILYLPYLEPVAMEIEKTAGIPDELFEKTIELGLFGVGILEEYGGQGGGHLMGLSLWRSLTGLALPLVQL